MSVFDTEKDQFDNIDESVAGNSLKDIIKCAEKLISYLKPSAFVPLTPFDQSTFN